MTSLFLVTSAIYTSYSKYSIEDRINQTKETFESIKKYAPDSSIVLLDCGEKSIDKGLFDYPIVDYTSHKEIQSHLQEYISNNVDEFPEIIIKSMLEILMFEDYFKTHTIEYYSRVFKLSGRYKLNNHFDYQKHLQAKNKIITLPYYISCHAYNFDVSSSLFECVTRCWSFDSNLIESVLKTFDKMKRDVLIASKSNKQTDIEHLFFKHLDKKFVKYINVIGIEWQSSICGSLIKE